MESKHSFSKQAVVVLIFALLLPMSCFALDSSVKKGYLQKIKSIQSDDQHRGTEYALCDIDDDGVPELLIADGHRTPQVSMIEIYTWQDDKLHLLFNDDWGIGHNFFVSKCSRYLHFDIIAAGFSQTIASLSKDGLKVNVFQGRQINGVDYTRINWHDLSDVKQLETAATPNQPKLSKPKKIGKHRSRKR